ncbi:succinate dehydrogenase, hydrophobic membrane anchor protein [Hydrocarboniclastica marina]|uniref:Succinate dehydrogenase hydrophobic membrane anchor subunit n=1 Tax=Hydrocarboniclastica marina TaxID=2259620 RepID=A0A4P7XGQ3_9ALTE|nr:succinate dehydrogenase, hydrophobic membrane anchor protein [Hydrocarboniclastica marina]MAL98338.1 succinate dehydrogenase, hydrophobic membrane anchor protein [Alteromonadaceae bacterium]QCF25895.1 succinate dehydrogenase, hydrophobic membrane anchor protein [Hydrocarboniclastica marina]|tara:strand:- start:2647 stop:2994 length:348 start_codon:yes stop_codon:yes gene_type:complete
MVTSITNFGRNGVYDWVFQRVTAVVLALYTLFLVGFVLASPELDYQSWAALFASTWMRIFSLMAIFSLAIHAWIGLWIVVTDYLKSAAVRFSFQIILGAVTFVYLVWGIQTLWGL